MYNKIKKATQHKHYFKNFLGGLFDFKKTPANKNKERTLIKKI